MPTDLKTFPATGWVPLIFCVEKRTSYRSSHVKSKYDQLRKISIKLPAIMLTALLTSATVSLAFTSSILALTTPLKFQNDLIISPTSSSNSVGTSSLRVPVILGVMSKCPDAILCESVFDKVIPLVPGLANIQLVYIAKLDDTAEIGVTCMHGENECFGNIQQLCAAKYWNYVDEESVQIREPYSDTWNFSQCMNAGTREEIGLLRIAKECAKGIGREWKGKVAKCAAGQEGINLLKDSLTLAQELNITKSCTMIINGKQICIHDGIYKECEGGHEPSDFARQIKGAWEEINTI